MFLFNYAWQIGLLALVSFPLFGWLAMMRLTFVISAYPVVLSHQHP